MSTTTDFKERAASAATAIVGELDVVPEKLTDELLHAVLAYAWGRGWQAGADEIHALGQEILTETRDALLHEIRND